MIISSKKIYKQLKPKTPYTTWLKRKIEGYKACEGVEYKYKDNNDILINEEFRDWIVLNHRVNKKYQKTDKFFNYQNNKGGWQRKDFLFIKPPVIKSKKKKSYSQLQTPKISNNTFNLIIDQMKPSINKDIEVIDEYLISKKFSKIAKNNKLLLEFIEKQQTFIDTLCEGLKIDFSSDPLHAKPIQTHSNKITPVLLLSDWHIGLNVSENHLHNLNAYNPKIANDRISNAIDNFILDYQDKCDHFDEIAIFILGDMIQNDMHDANIDLSVSEQVIECSKILIDNLKKIELNLGKKLLIYGVTGNHGRINPNKFMPLNKPLVSSLENIIFYILAQNGFQVKTDPSNELLIEINSLKIYATHGHDLKVNKNSPNSLINNLNKKQKQFLSLDLNRFDLVLMGHYHSPFNFNNKLIIAGSPVGMDEYAKSLGVESYDPCITSFAITLNKEVILYKLHKCQ